MHVAARAGRSQILWGFLAGVSVPFVLTGVFRIASSVPTWLPFAMALTVAGGLWPVRGLRPIAAGIAVGASIHAALLNWIFSQWESLP